MISVRLFGRCRIYHDPVSPVLRDSATIGWEAWFRSIDLEIQRPLKGRELLMRTRGWWTVEPLDVLEVVEKYGKLKVGDKGELMVEVKDSATLDLLSNALSERFGEQALVCS
jgi:hypothetical protein